MEIFSYIVLGILAPIMLNLMHMVVGIYVVVQRGNVLSLGFSDPENYFRREFYSPIYYSLRYFFVQAFPLKFHLEIGHLVNLFF